MLSIDPNAYRENMFPEETPSSSSSLPILASSQNPAIPLPLIKPVNLKGLQKAEIPVLNISVKVHPLPAAIANYDEYRLELKGWQRINRYIHDFMNKVKQIFRIFNAKTPRSEKLNSQLMVEMVRAHPGESGAELADLLEYTSKMWDQAEGEKSLGDSIHEAANWSREIQRLNNKKNITPHDKGLKGLLFKMKAKINHLEADEKVLIPCQWLKNERREMGFIEVKKNAAGTYDLQFISMDPSYKTYWAGVTAGDTTKEKHIPILRFENVLEGDISRVLEPLVHIQLSKIYEKPEQEKLGAINKRIKMGLKLMAAKTSEEKSGDATGSTEVDPLNILITILRQTPIVLKKGPLVDTSAQTSAFKTLLVYIKTQDPSHYRENKLKLEIAAFFELVQSNSNAFVKNREFRRLVYDSAIKLQRELIVKSKSTSLETQQIINKLIRIKETADRIEREAQNFEAPEVETLPFEESFQLPALTKVSYKQAADKSIDTLSPILFARLDFSNPSIPLAKTLEPALEELQRLLAQKRYDLVEQGVRTIAHQLVIPELEGAPGSFWKSQLGSQETTKALSDLGELHFNAVAFQGKRPTGEILVTHATLMACLDQASIRASPWKTPVFFDPKGLVKALKEDPYLRIRSPFLHKRAQAILNYWKSIEQNPTRVKLHLDNVEGIRWVLSKIGGRSWGDLTAADFKDDSARAYFEDVQDKELKYIFDQFEAKLKDKTKLITQDDIISVFGEIDPQKAFYFHPEVIQQRRLRLYGNILVSNYAAMQYSSPLQMFSIFNSVASEEGTEALSPREMFKRLWDSGISRVKGDLQEAGRSRKMLTWSVDKQDRLLLGSKGLKYDPEAAQRRIDQAGDPEIFKGAIGEVSEELEDRILRFQVADQNKGARELTPQALPLESKNSDEAALRSCQTQETRLEQTLAYFMGHPDKLDDPQNRLYFEMVFFEQGKLMGRLKEQPRLASNLIQQLIPLYDVAYQTEKIERATYLLSLIQALYDFQPDLIKEKDLPNEWARLEQKAALTEKNTVLTRKLAYYYDRIQQGEIDLSKFDSPKRDAFALEMIAAYFKAQSSGLSNTFKDPEIESKGDALIQILSPFIKDKIDRDAHQKWIKALLGQLEIPIPPKPLTGKYPVLKAGMLSIDFSKGRILNRGKAKTSLPEDLRTIPFIQEIMKKEEMSQMALVEKRYGQGGTVMEVFTIPSHPNIRILREEGKKPVVQVRLNSIPYTRLLRTREWFEYVPFGEGEKEEGKARIDWPGEMEDLVRGRWALRGGPHGKYLVVYDPKSKKCLYHAELTIEEDRQSLKKVKRLSDGLELLNLKPGKDLKSFSDIEDPSHIHLWGQGREVKEWEFTRILSSSGAPLAFKVIKKEGSKKPVLESVNYPGQFLAHDPGNIYFAYEENRQDLREFFPSFYKGYFLLLGERNSKKVLLPRTPMVPAPNGEQLGQGWSAPFSLAHRPSTAGPVSVYEYDVDTAIGALNTKDKEHALYLAYFYFTSAKYGMAVEFGSYGKVLEYLRLADTSMELTPSLERLYKWIDDWKDTTPAGSAIKLHAMLQLEVSRQRGAKTRSDEQLLYDIDRLTRLYQKYKSYKDSGQLDKGLYLPEERKSFYKHVLLLTHLDLAPLEPLESTPLASATPQAPGFMATQKDLLPPNSMAEILFLQMEDRDVLEKDFVLTSETALVKGFQKIYQELWHVPLDSDRFKVLENHIRLSNSTSSAARAARGYLITLIELKRAGKDLAAVKFPEAFKLPYFRHSKVKALISANPSLTLLTTFLKTVKGSADSILPADSKAATPKTEKKQEGARKVLGALRFADEVGKHASPEEVRYGYGTAKELEKAPEGFQDDPAEVLRHLKKIGRLEETMRLRRHAELMEKKRELERKVESIPLQSFLSEVWHRVETPLIKAKSLSAIFTSSEAVANSKSDATEALAGFLETSSIPLARKYGADIRTWLSKPVDSEISLNRKELDEYRVKLKKELTDISDKQKAFEYTITHSLGNRVRAEGVPARLQGLFLDDKWDDINKIYGVQLNAIQIEHLKQAYPKWLVNVIQIRYLNSVAGAIDALGKHPTPEKIKELHQLMSTNRFFDQENLTDPRVRAFLLIEFFSGFNLRQNQIQTIRDMLEGTNLLKQLGMGSGKSSVILPILLRLKAMNGSLAIGVIPEWLLEIVSGDLDKMSREVFGQDLYLLKFDRSTPVTEESLLQIYVFCAQAIEIKGAVITTKTALLSFKNRFIELCSQREQTTDKARQESLSKQIKLMADTLGLLRSRGDVIADEVDTILDVRQMLIYGIGDPKKIDPVLCKTGLGIFKKILSWEAGEDTVLARFATAIKNNDQIYFKSEDIKAIKIAIAIDYHKTYLAGSSITVPEFVEYLTKKDPNCPGFYTYLAALRREDPESYTTLSYLRRFVLDTLDTTLTKSVDVHYGRSGPDTVPYLANNKPSQAEYGDVYERIAFLVQDYLQKGLTLDQTKGWVDKLLAQVQAEMLERFIEGGVMSQPCDMPTWKAFSAQYPEMDLLLAAKDLAARKKLTDLINKDPESIFSYLESWVFTEQSISETQISSNAHDLVPLVKAFSGFTGTPWNLDTFHQALSRSHAEEPGTDGKSLDILARTHESKALKILVQAINPANPLKSIMSLQGFKQYSSLIDAGYYLKGINNDEAAAQLAQARHQPCVYVTPDNQKRVKKIEGDEQRLETASIKPRERITYYDQAHTIGTDLPHDDRAVALVTLSEKMYLKDLLQSIWRMRKLDKGQRIHFLISDKVDQLIRERHVPKGSDKPIELNELILFCIQNQAERVADDNLRGQKQKISQAVPEAMFWDLVTISAHGPAQASEQAYKAYQPTLLKQTPVDVAAASKPTPLQDSSAVLEKMKENELKKARALHLRDAEIALENLTLLSSKDLPPQTVATTTETADSQVETQREQEQQTMTELKSQSILNEASVKRCVWKANTLKDLWTQMEAMRTLGQSIPLLDAERNIVLSPNFVSPIVQEPELVLHELLHGKRLETAQVLVIKNKATGEMKALLMDIREYETTLRKLVASSDQTAYIAAVYDVRPQKESLLLRSTESGHIDPWSNEEKQSMTVLLVKIKLLNHQTTFLSKPEIDVLKQMASPALGDFYQKNLLRPADRPAWKTSMLYKLFN